MFEAEESHDPTGLEGPLAVAGRDQLEGGCGWGAWVAPSVPTLAQVTILPFASLSPMLGSVLTAQSLEPALDSVSPSLPAPLLLVLSLSLSLSFSLSLK